MPVEIHAGGPRVSRVLTRLVASGRIPHALLFSGPGGSGRRDAARQLALTLLCENTSKRPCEECSACQRLIHGTHPDFIRVAPDGARLKIDQIRSLIHTLDQGPYESAVRVAVVEEAEALTPEAANALLKTLEEPAAGTVLILIVTHEAALLPTLQSRCQKIIFPTPASFAPSENKSIDDAVKSLLRSGASVPFRIAQSLDADKTDQEAVITSLLSHYEQRLRQGEKKAAAALETIGRAASAFDRHANGRLTLDTLFLKLWDIENQNAEAAQ